MRKIMWKMMIKLINEISPTWHRVGPTPGQRPNRPLDCRSPGIPGAAMVYQWIHLKLVMFFISSGILNHPNFLGDDILLVYWIILIFWEMIETKTYQNDPKIHPQSYWYLTSPGRVASRWRRDRTKSPLLFQRESHHPGRIWQDAQMHRGWPIWKGFPPFSTQKILEWTWTHAKVMWPLDGN